MKLKPVQAFFGTSSLISVNLLVVSKFSPRSSSQYSKTQVANKGMALVIEACWINTKMIIFLL